MHGGRSLVGHPDRGSELGDLDVALLTAELGGLGRLDGRRRYARTTHQSAQSNVAAAARGIDGWPGQLMTQAPGVSAQVATEEFGAQLRSYGTSAPTATPAVDPPPPSVGPYPRL